MNMKKLSQLFLLLAVLAVPFTMTSCDDDDPWHDGPYWPNDRPGQGDSQDDADQMVATLCNRWQGDMYYTYTDGTGAKRRVTEVYEVEMNFFRYENSSERYAGQGVEVDKNESGDTQVLNFTWWIDTQRGDIYVKYTDSKTVFRMDASSEDHGFHLGWEKERNAYTFFGYLEGQSNDDEIYIDLERVSTDAKAALGVDAQPQSTFSFGRAAENRASQLRVNAIPRLHRR